jgi:DNA polymerase zeta
MPLVPHASPDADRAYRALAPRTCSGLELDATYYIERVLLPPLSRILNLLGADVEQWYRTMPKPKLVTAAPFGDSEIQKAAAKKKKKLLAKLTDHFQSDLCFLCQAPTDKGARRCCFRKHPLTPADFAMTALSPRHLRRLSRRPDPDGLRAHGPPH